MMMATFDELRANRDKLALRVAALRRALAMGELLLDRANAELGPDALSPQTALLLQELNRELKRDNDEAEAKDVKRT